MQGTHEPDFRPLPQQVDDLYAEHIEDMDAIGDNLEALLAKNRRDDDDA